MTSEEIANKLNTLYPTAEISVEDFGPGRSWVDIWIAEKHVIVETDKQGNYGFDLITEENSFSVGWSHYIEGDPERAFSELCMFLDSLLENGVK